MARKPHVLTASEAARRLGVSAKTLRLYEQHGLLMPDRSRAGWRAYGTGDLARAAEILSLRKLGFGLAEIGRLQTADAMTRSDTLARHQSKLESQMHDLRNTLRNVNNARNASLTTTETTTGASNAISFELPWPWDGERFALPALAPLTYLTGPLGSGKTRLAMRLAKALSDGRFLGLERVDDQYQPYADRIKIDADLQARCADTLHRLKRNGATESPALLTLLVAIQSHVSAPLVIDMVEQGLDHATQSALMVYLRGDDRPPRPLVLMTRSSAILDLALAESGETIIYCPANHGVPLIVHPEPSCPGYEAVAGCLATPEVRARTAGMIATWANGNPAPLNDSRETFS